MEYKKAFIFDRDGVIINSEQVNLDSALAAFNILGIQPTEEEKGWIIGRHPDSYILDFAQRYPVELEQFKQVQRITYYPLLETAPLFAPTLTLIQRLKDWKIPLALTTSSDRFSTDKILRRAGLEDAFEVVFTYNDCLKRKPAPNPYLMTAAKLNTGPKRCIVLEDSEVGVNAAKAAHMICIALPNQYTKKQDLSKADYNVKSADEIDLSLLNHLWENHK